MIEVNGLLDRIRQSPINIEELQNIDLIVCEGMVQQSEQISVAEADYAAAFLEELDTGYKMTLSKAEWKARQQTNGSYHRAQREYAVLQKVHEHIMMRIKALTVDKA